MWVKGPWDCWSSFVPVPQGRVNKADLFVPVKLYVVATSYSFISWLCQALSLLESEVLVKMQKNITFYYYPQFFRGEPS